MSDMLYDLCKLLDKKAVISIAKSCRYVKKKEKKNKFIIMKGRQDVRQN